MGDVRPLPLGGAAVRRRRVSSVRCLDGALDAVINPYLLYVGLALGGLGVCMALPRRRVSPQVLGAVLAGLGLGVVLLGLGLRSERLPNFNFYIFSAIALGAALRVITHPRPVYAALYFILTILASCGLYLVLAAEFMAFALVIIYAGAILITYLFVIMLATQAPSEGELEALAEYDAEARSPVAATVASFVLLAALTTMLFGGAGDLRPRDGAGLDAPIEMMPQRAERSLREEGLIAAGDEVVGVDAAAWTATLRSGEVVALPASARLTNVERIGHDLLAEHPGSIEIAGVILLMAMLGATVLSRRQVELEDDAKRRQSERLAAAGTVFADREANP